MKKVMTGVMLAALTGFGAGRPEEAAQPISENLKGRENIEWSIGYAYGVTDETRHLPRVLLVGDSITAQNHRHVRTELAGKLNVSYWASSYCASTPRYLPLLEFYLNDAKYDVIHFNNGLHSLWTSDADWERGFRAALELIRRKQPQAKVIWCSSTPYTPYKADQNAKVVARNAQAAKIVAEYGFPTDDLHTPMARLFPTAWSDGVHFHEAVQKVQAKHVANSILKAFDGVASLKLAEGGVAKAKIVLAKKANRAARFAAYELKWHLDRITGAKFEVVNDVDLMNGRDARSTGGALILVGESELTNLKSADFQRQQFLVDIRRDAITLMGRDKEDKGAVTYYNDAQGVRGVGWPNMFDEQGTMYAVYEFLEEVVGVRWLDSTDFGTVLPNKPDLTVPVLCRSGAPFIRYRAHSGVPSRYQPLLWKTNEQGYRDYESLAYANPKARNQQGELFQIRHRMGGECLPANHSFYDFYDKYWKKDAKGFVAYHPEYFAKGYAEGTLPPQLCYSNTGTVAQVIADIRAYFDDPKGLKRWGKDNYCLEPMDNSSFCKCPDCTKEYEPSREGDYSSQSTHWYRFVNKVAKAIKESHPDKRLCTLAYFQHEGLPTGLTLEDNVTVYFCLSGNRSPYAPLLNRQLARMEEWREAYPNQPLAMWLYNCFPAENAHNGNFHCFPGFFSKEEERQYEIFRRLNARDGIFHCGFDGEVDNYIQLEKMIDPTKPVETLKDDYFAMYGKAAPFVRGFYDLVEERYCDPKTYPKTALGHQSAPIAWGIVGTKDVMDRLADLMAKAESAAETADEKARVELWKRGVWNYMKEGYDSFTTRMKAPMPSWTAKRVSSAEGDPKKVDWTKAESYPVKFFGAGSDELSGYDGNLRFAHDGKWFYFELAMTVPDTTTLVNLPAICSHDCWEILMARQKGQPYRCWFVAPDGRVSAASWGEVNFRSGVSSEESGLRNYGAVSVADTSNGRDWIARFAFPLDTFLDGPMKPGDAFHLNAVNCMGNEHPEVRKWCETHGGRFIMSTLTSHTTVHTTDRIGTVTLEK